MSASDLTEHTPGEEDQQVFQELSLQVQQLERRELNQMKENARLRRKMDAMSKELQDLTHREDVAEPHQPQEASPPSLRASVSMPLHGVCGARDLELLEETWNRELEELSGRAEELDGEVEDAVELQQQLEKQLGYWRRCGKELVEQREVEETAAAEKQRLQQLLQQLQRETFSGLEENSASVKAKLSEVERIAEVAHTQRSRSLTRVGHLATACSTADAAVATHQARAQALRQREETLRGRTGQQAPQPTAKPKPTLETITQPQDGSAPGAAAARLRARLRERQRELDALQAQGASLQGPLQRTPLSNTAGVLGTSSAEDSAGPRRPLDDFMAWFAMLLFSQSGMAIGWPPQGGRTEEPARNGSPQGFRSASLDLSCTAKALAEFKAAARPFEGVLELGQGYAASKALFSLRRKPAKVALRTWEALCRNRFRKTLRPLQSFPRCRGLLALATRTFDLPEPFSDSWEAAAFEAGEGAQQRRQGGSGSGSERGRGRGGLNVMLRVYNPGEWLGRHVDDVELFEEPVLSAVLLPGASSDGLRLSLPHSVEGLAAARSAAEAAGAVHLPHILSLPLETAAGQGAAWRVAEAPGLGVCLQGAARYLFGHEVPPVQQKRVSMTWRWFRCDFLEELKNIHKWMLEEGKA